ncbi:TPA: restriction endonuclease, partial [Streptococcus pneumoniae]|nr:restriction endonuclease [Streptococcus pneumoniae]HEW8053577.1 restriction endonuclease [Streptococcus pneumoniae]
LLEDYLRGSYDEVETLETLKKAFELTNNDQTGQQDTGDNDADN